MKIKFLKPDLAEKLVNILAEPNNESLNYALGVASNTEILILEVTDKSILYKDVDSRVLFIRKVNSYKGAKVWHIIREGNF